MSMSSMFPEEGREYAAMCVKVIVKAIEEVSRAYHDAYVRLSAVPYEPLKKAPEEIEILRVKCFPEKCPAFGCVDPRMEGLNKYVGSKRDTCWVSAGFNASHLNKLTVAQRGVLLFRRPTYPFSVGLKVIAEVGVKDDPERMKAVEVFRSTSEYDQMAARLCGMVGYRPRRVAALVKQLEAVSGRMRASCEKERQRAKRILEKESGFVEFIALRYTAEEISSLDI